jgi:hypothetical protein
MTPDAPQPLVPPSEGGSPGSIPSRGRSGTFLFTIAFSILWLSILGGFFILQYLGPEWVRSVFYRHPSAYRLRATASMDKGDTNGAERDARAAITRETFDFDARFLLADVQLRQGDRDGAYGTLGEILTFRNASDAMKRVHSDAIRPARCIEWEIWISPTTGSNRARDISSV